ncbi:MAG: SAM-dependent methyltransferase [Methanobacteriota archaeon]
MVHWTEEMFIEHADVWLEIHERAWPHGEEQAKDLAAILARHGVGAGAGILDAPCGIGRHATHLAKLGFRTVGVDLSPAFVERAGTKAREAGVTGRARFVVGDLRRLGGALRGEPPFDAALNLWTSFGYYDEPTDVTILRGYADAVRPGGTVLLYVANRDYIVRHFDPHGYEAFGDLVHIEMRRLDLDASRVRNEWRFFRRRGDDLEHVATVRVDHRAYALHELRALFERTGWHVEAAYGGYRMNPPSVDAPTLLVVGRR